jgi:uncharacterized protein YndB with AHSA1/START domain
MTIKVKYTAEISQPIELAFAVATNVAQITQWAEIKAVRQLSSNPVKVGTTFQLLSHIGGEDRLIDCKVTVLEPNRKFVYVSGGLARSEVVMEFQPAPHSCTLIYTVSITANAFIEPLIRSDVEKRAKADVARLVRLIAAN